MSESNKNTNIDFKTGAKNLRRALSEFGIEINHGNALNILARTFGHKDYNTYVASSLGLKPKIQIDEVPELAQLKMKDTKYHVGSLVHTITKSDDRKSESDKNKKKIEKMDVIGSLLRNADLGVDGHTQAHFYKSHSPYNVNISVHDQFNVMRQDEMQIFNLDGSLKKDIIGQIRTEYKLESLTRKTYKHTIKVSGGELDEQNYTHDDLTISIKLGENIVIQKSLYHSEEIFEMLVDGDTVSFLAPSFMSDDEYFDYEIDYDLFVRLIKELDGKNSVYYENYKKFLRSEDKKLAFYNCANDNILSSTDSSEEDIDEARKRLVLLLIDDKFTGALHALEETFSKFISIVKVKNGKEFTKHSSVLTTLSQSSEDASGHEDSSDFTFNYEATGESIIFHKELYKLVF